MIGQTISHYKILDKLGEGGMGVVYKAQDTKLDRLVALKFLPSQVPASEQELARFQQEAKAISALNHPNIATIHDIDEGNAMRFLVLEYLSGGTLKSMIKELHSVGKELRIQDVISYGVQIANGLSYAHRRGIIHRDVKTDNMILTDEGNVKITDFGVAKLRGSAQLTRTGTTVGTAAYMSPEQVRGEELDHRSDIFSLGVVLYELAAGHLPFRGEHEAALGYSIVNEDPVPLKSLRPDVPSSLVGIINRCLEKEKEKRYQNAEKLSDDLNALVGQGQRQSSVQSTLTFAKKVLRSRTGILVALVSLVLMTIIGIFIISRSGSVESPNGLSRTAIAVLPFSIRGSPELNYLGEGMVNLLSTKLDGAGELRSIDPRALLGFVTRELGPVVDPDQGMKAARHFGAGFFVMGDIIEVGSKLQISATLYDARKGIVEVGRGTAGGEVPKLFEVVDEIAAQMLVKISGERGQPSARVKQLAAVTTSSLPALKFYLEGEGALRAGRIADALAAFRGAVSEDTTFALGYYRLSIAAEWALRAGLAHEMAESAFRHASRLSERDHKLFEALLFYRQGDALKAEELYRAIVGTYPDDVEAWMQLGEVLFHYIPLHARSAGESRESFEKVLSYEPDHSGALVHLARLAAMEKNPARLDSFVQRLRALNPQGDRTLPMRALQVFTYGTENAEEEILAQLEHASDATAALAIWEVAVFGGNLRGAERICRVVTTSGHSAEVRSAVHVWLAHIFLARGQWNQAKRELSLVEPLDRAAFLEYSALLSCFPVLSVDKSELVLLRKALRELNPERVPTSSNPTFFFSSHNGLHSILRTYLLGILSVRLGEGNEALQYAKQVETQTAPPGAGSLAADLSLSIRAQVEMSSGRDNEALAILDRTRRRTWYELVVGSPFYSQAFERFLGAELILKVGNHQEARKWYHRLVSTSVFEVVYLPISYYRLGQIYQDSGDHAAAADHYRKFIELWSNCDAQLRPMVDDAQKRLQKLKK